MRLPGMVLLGLFPILSHADALPYSLRTRSYNGYASTVRGDIRTVGMAGATVALGDTFIAATSNPAGLAMTLNHADSNLAGNSIRDSYIQNYEYPLGGNSMGVAAAIYPWGFSLGYTSPFREGMEYGLPPAEAQRANLSVTTREFRVAVARTLWNDRLALGGSLNLGQVERQIDLLPAGGASVAHHAYAFGATVGATFQLPRRWFLGMSYTLPLHYSADPLNNPTPGVTDFFQPVDTPEILGLGLGWIPNTYFRADLTTYVVGRTPAASLLRDEAILVGQNRTLQPRLGVAYTFADFAHLQGTAFAGTYFEWTRVEGTDNRMHATLGTEFKVWVMTVGAGLDLSKGYRNYLASIGIDIFKVMEKADLIPNAYRPPPAGFFPDYSRFSDEGLPRPIVKDWKPQGPSIDPIAVGLDLPKKIQQKIESIGKPNPAIPKTRGAQRSGGPKKTPKKSSKKKPRKAESED